MNVRPHLLAAAVAAIVLAAPARAQERVGTVVDNQLSDALPRGVQRSEKTLSVAGASMLRLHFTKIALGPGDRLDLFDGTGKLIESFTDAPINNLWSLLVYAQPARLVLSTTRGGTPSYTIDQIMQGNPIPVGFDPCGPACPDNLNIECVNPGPEYNNNRPVCRLHGFTPSTVDSDDDGQPDMHDVDGDGNLEPIVIIAAFTCTGWMVGSPDCLLTNWHCTHITDANVYLDLNNDGDVQTVPAQSPANPDWAFGLPLIVEGFLAEFNAQCDACDPDDADNTVGATYRIDGFVPGNDPFGHAAKQTLDYGLLDTTGAPGVNQGTLDVSTAYPFLGSSMYCINHSLGGKKGIGFGEFEFYLQPGSCGSVFPLIETQIFYSTALAGGSSGSPVFCGTTHQVVALNHCGPAGAGCANPSIGVPMALIAPEIAPAMDAHGCAYTFTDDPCDVPTDLTIKCTAVGPDPGNPNCCLFLWEIKNNSGFVVDEFYLDIEAGTGEQICNAANDIALPGWTHAFCYGWDFATPSNWAVVRFTDNRLFPGQSQTGALSIDVNGPATVHAAIPGWEEFKVPADGIHVHVTSAIPLPGQCRAGQFGPHILGQGDLWSPGSNWLCDLTPDTEDCLGDINGDGAVGILDFLAILANWGPCSKCPADISGDGTVGITDMLAVLAGWGPCTN